MEQKEESFYLYLSKEHEAEEPRPRPEVPIKSLPKRSTSTRTTYRRANSRS